MYIENFSLSGGYARGPNRRPGKQLCRQMAADLFDVSCIALWFAAKLMADWTVVSLF